MLMFVKSVFGIKTRADGFSLITNKPGPYRFVLLYEGNILNEDYIWRWMSLIGLLMGIMRKATGDVNFSGKKDFLFCVM